MKKNLIVFLQILIGLSTFSQPVVKIFAYEQDSLPGMKAVGKTENEKAIKKAAAAENYLIFLSYNKSYSIAPIQIFIKGNEYKISKIENKKTPVDIVNKNLPSDPKKTELVAFTKNKVIQLRVNKEIKKESKPVSVEKLASLNDVVVVYKWKNWKYFLTVKELTRLEPVFNE